MTQPSIPPTPDSSPPELQLAPTPIKASAADGTAVPAALATQPAVPSFPRRVWTFTKRLLNPISPKATSWWNRFPSSWELWALLLAVTLAGAWLRFWRLGHQSYWYDEGQTIERICGTWDQMIQSLASGQGFPPGWYALLRWWREIVEWWTGSAAFSYSPAGLRTLPAVFGTLMIPCMYFLARQFTDRKGALLVALITAVNPYFIFYSRDIKMYMALWFFMTLHIALFFQWLTIGRHWLYVPLLAITACIASSFHAIAFFLVPLELLWLLFRPRLKPMDGLLWILSTGAMALLPLWWYLSKNQWLMASVTGARNSGVDWNKDYTDMSWATIAGLPTSQLLGYLWPRSFPDARMNYWFGLGDDFNQHLATRYLPWLVDDQIRLALIVGGIMLIGLIPWRGPRPTLERRRSATQGRWWYLALWIGLPTVIFAATWIPKDSPWYEPLWGWYPKDNSANGITPLWEPRYLGFIAPAFILWLSAALRRLPAWPLRMLAIIFVLTACAASSLVNHLAYRQNPWGPTADAIAQYANLNDPVNRRSVAIGTPFTRFPSSTDLLEYNARAGIAPELARVQSFNLGVPYARWRRTLEEEEVTGFVDAMGKDADVKTIILTDRDGDLATGPLTDDALAKRLGPRWQRVFETTYGWYYEWRYFFFHTWRTRVWSRVALTAPAMSQSAARNTATRPASSAPATRR